MKEYANSSGTTTSGGGCPVMNHKNDGNNNDHNNVSWWQRPFYYYTGKNRTDTTSSSNRNSSSSSNDSSNTTIASIEEYEQYSQKPQFADQSIYLSTDRMVSSIPRSSSSSNDGDSGLPGHQTSSSSCPVTSNDATNNKSSSSSNEKNHWVYPSEQQFFNAVRRKGWDHVEDKSIPMVLMIHNSINERTWEQIKQWEHCSNDATDAASNTNASTSTNVAAAAATTTTDHPKNESTNKTTATTPSTTTTTTPSTPTLELSKFHGRPNDLSIKATINTYLFGYNQPFDRHDWYVKNNKTQTTTRYIIDYYMMENSATSLSLPFIDARPAIDGNPFVLFRWARRLCEDAFPNVFGINQHYTYPKRLFDTNNVSQQLIKKKEDKEKTNQTTT